MTVADVVCALRRAAAELALTEPVRGVERNLIFHACHGVIRGLDAKLVLGGRSEYTVSVDVSTSGLPPLIHLGPRCPERPDDWGLDTWTDSGDRQFDEHFCVYGDRYVGDALRSVANTIQPEVLDFVAGSFKPSFEIILSSIELRVSPKRTWVPYLGPTPASEDFVQLWRYAERLVDEGVGQRVLAAPG